jgi:hypothetical protein
MIAVEEHITMQKSSIGYQCATNDTNRFSLLFPPTTIFYINEPICLQDMMVLIMLVQGATSPWSLGEGESA